MGNAIKMDIKMEVLRARVILLFGEFEDVKHMIPFGLACEFDSGTHIARCLSIERDGKYPFVSVIHSRSIAISVIAHEALHAANFILESLGCKPDFENDEIQAYIVQHICEKCEDRLGTYK